MKTCDQCKFCVLKDEGYSNYTVENTSVNCAESKHPDAPFDRFYGEDERLQFAETCSSFIAGDAVELDVDGETWQGLTDEEKLIAKRAGFEEG